MNELSKTYEPHDVEDKWIDQWLTSGVFKPGVPDPKKPAFSVVIPPPNVTGSLHMGHALNSTLQDILVRYHRMKGDNTLWVVGTDHAGIATQNVVERQLAAEGKTRFDLGREKFVERVWKWRHESGGTIIGQLKRLGASCDYDNERFTMDEGLSHAVKKVFVQLFDEGLIYRGERLINWCPRCHTALSDLEVEHADQKGSLWHILYKSEDGKEAMSVATTRPETLLGDVAVAVHPDDDRWKSWIGKKVQLPLTGKLIPVIADEFVDLEFGSGVVKITPAHDFNDFAVGERHKLPRINILTEDGKLNENGLAYQGLTVKQARDKVIEDLKSQELLEKEEAHVNRVGTCYRCKTVVEPYLSLQWFVKAKPLADEALAAVKNDATQFVPRHWEKTYFNWMENIQDWCISRQIWWGHQIPAWYCDGDCPPIVSETTPTVCNKCGSNKLTQDEDVLDTWFSSALWPFSTLGWPEKTPELATYYPTSTLVTAFDIIFFWVARMMMMGIHFMKEVPFKHVHIHALVRDPTGAKMSKSKGNVVDPLLMMTKYGTDAFRFTLTAFAAQGRDIKLDEARIEGYRNFCNKIWNATRFAMMNAAPFVKSTEDFKNVDPKIPANQWILCELGQTIEAITSNIENYEFNKAASAAYSFFWLGFCDSYLELTKIVFQDADSTPEAKEETSKVIYYVLDVAMRMLHPFMPFITEEIWQILGDRGDASIVKAPYPEKITGLEKYKTSWKDINLLIETISAVRSVRQETGLPLTKEISIEIKTSDKKFAEYQKIASYLSRMGKVTQVELRSGEFTEAVALIQVPDAVIGIPLLMNGIDSEKYKERQAKNLQKTQKDISLLKQKLDDAKFVESAPAELIEEKKGQLAEALVKKASIDLELKLLG